jgi:hypothetical protein
MTLDEARTIVHKFLKGHGIAQRTIAVFRDGTTSAIYFKHYKNRDGEKVLMYVPEDIMKFADSRQKRAVFMLKDASRDAHRIQAREPPKMHVTLGDYELELDYFEVKEMNNSMQDDADADADAPVTEEDISALGGHDQGYRENVHMTEDEEDHYRQTMKMMEQEEHDQEAATLYGNTNADSKRSKPFPRGGGGDSWFDHSTDESFELGWTPRDQLRNRQRRLAGKEGARK